MNRWVTGSDVIAVRRGREGYVLGERIHEDGGRRYCLRSFVQTCATQLPHHINYSTARLGAVPSFDLSFEAGPHDRHTAPVLSSV
jgi:hypothetical protein